MRAVECIYACDVNTGYSREHVMPRAFGTFPDNMTLREHVCAECNGYFSRVLEDRISKGSWEAILALQYDVRRATHVQLDPRQVRTSIDEPGGHQGILVRPKVVDGVQTAELAPQVGFRRRGEQKWTHYTVQELRSAHAKGQSPPQFDELWVIADGPADQDLVMQTLTLLGIAFRPLAEMKPTVPSGSTIRVLMEFEVTPEMPRLMAKVCFNYLAHELGRAFAMRPEFDAVRRYIRLGEGKPADFVRTKTKPILYGETSEIAFTRGHIVSLSYGRSHRTIKMGISIFNSITYEVILTERHDGLARTDFTRGHIFDWEQGTISPLTTLSPYSLLARPSRHAAHLLGLSKRRR